MEFRGRHTHSHDRSSLPSFTHSHEGAEGHGHTHENWPDAGSFTNREKPIEVGRNWSERAFTVGIGG
jgi:urease accessory protein